MNISNRFFPLLCGLLLTGAAVRADPLPAATAPVEDFILPTFNADGSRSMLLRSLKARLLPDRVIELDDMQLTVFSGDKTNRVDSVLLSPVARASLNDDTVRGPGAVRLIRDDLDLSGEDWVYDHSKKSISLARNVRVVFHSQLKDLLK